MKELLIVRHGKSSWDDPDLTDRERPLKRRGREAAPDMGRRLHARGIVPERVVTSDARRAYDTAALIAEAMSLGHDALAVEPRLYTERAFNVLTVARAVDDAWRFVALVGHNPALHDLVHQVSDLRLNKLPTAAVVHLRFAVEHWSAIAPGGAEVVDYDYPKSGRS